MKMGYILIALGLVIAVIGVIIIAKPSGKPEQHEQTEVTEKQETKPVQSSKEKGNQFEAYVADILNGADIRIKQWNQGTVTQSGAMGENALNPDFFVEQPLNNSKLEYWIECKWRADIGNGFTFPHDQLERYRKTQHDSKRKVLVMFGIGGAPENPESVYIIPLDSIKTGSVTKEDLRPFYYSDPETQLKPRISKWFRTEVFKK